jgi:glycosyltransferase involved in cell wall biosynthesis
VRIDFVTTELRPGGAERALVEIALASRAAGDQPRVITLASPPPVDQSQLVQRLAEASIPYVPLHANRLWDWSRAVRGLKQQWQADRPEVVQTFLFHANALALRTAQKVGVCVTVAGLRVAQSSRWRDWMETAPLRKASAVVAVSRAVGEQARRANRARSDQLHVIPNGVDVQHIASAPAFDWSTVGIQPGCDVVVWVGRLHLQKGIDWLLQAAPLLIDADRRVALVIVGDGPIRAAVDRAIDRLPGRRVVALGWRDDVASLMRSSALVLQTSRYEGMANTILEAMAAGRACVSTAVEGIDEQFGPSTTAQTVPFGDTKRLVARVMDLLSNPAERSQIEAANQLRAQSQFSIAAMTNAYRRLYQQLLTRP